MVRQVAVSLRVLRLSKLTGAECLAHDLAWASYQPGGTWLARLHSEASQPAV
jgi:hypothetical protein